MIRERQVFPPLEPASSASTNSAKEASVVPPASCIETLGTLGGSSERAPEASAAGGGTSGFTNFASAWDCICSQPETLSDLLEFVNELDEKPDLRAAAFLRSVGRLRDEIDRIPEHAPMDSPVVLKLQDAVVLARALLSRFR